MSPSRITEIYGMSLYSSMYRYPGCMPDTPCMSIAHIPFPEASVCNVNPLEKSGSASTGAEVDACLRASKDSCSCEFQENTAPFFKRSDSGLLMDP
jgi:hypothetical protein